MKLLLLTIFILSVQTTPESFDVKKEVETAFEKCVQDYDRKKMTTIWKQDIFPEDDDFLKFYGCFGEELNLIDKDGELNFEILAEHHEDFVKFKFGNNMDAKKFVKGLSEHCFHIPKVEPKELNFLRRRNCGVQYMLNNN